MLNELGTITPEGTKNSMEDLTISPTSGKIESPIVLERVSFVNLITSPGSKKSDSTNLGSSRYHWRLL
jgi:hypothetical protein